MAASGCIFGGGLEPGDGNNGGANNGDGNNGGTNNGGTNNGGANNGGANNGGSNNGGTNNGEPNNILCPPCAEPSPVCSEDGLEQLVPIQDECGCGTGGYEALPCAPDEVCFFNFCERVDVGPCQSAEFEVSPHSAILGYPIDDGLPDPPLFIPLDEYGYRGVISLSAVGEWYKGGGEPPQRFVNAVFVETEDWAPVDGVFTPIAIPEGEGTEIGFSEGVAIDGDLVISPEPVVVSVPPGAQFLAVGVYDPQNYNDNSAAELNLFVDCGAPR